MSPSESEARAFPHDALDALVGGHRELAPDPLRDFAVDQDKLPEVVVHASLKQQFIAHMLKDELGEEGESGKPVSSFAP